MHDNIAPVREFLLSEPQDWSQAPPGCKPGVSVILRTRDRPEFLRRAIASVNAQTFRDIGICLINDGGDRNETEAIVRGGLSSDIAVDFIHNATSVGRPAARNLGFARVDREFFCVHDDDDAWSEQFLATMVDFLRRAGGAGYIGAACESDRIIESFVDGRIHQVSRGPHWRRRGALSLFDSLELISHPPPISVLMRSHALALRNNVAMTVLYDCEWLARVLLRADVGVVSSVLAFYHRREREERELGAARNSVFEFDDEFYRLRILLENELLRADLSRGQLGLGFALSLAHRLRGGQAALSHEATRFIERKAKAYFRRKAARRRIKSAFLRVFGRKPRDDDAT